ncbi:MAG: glutamine--fructose-6-phosphate aminotransferase, partial [Clostridia bacterium]|nr:glutamine--fructose-6-phosphate aminotransferase [Clostridia bacterium]
MCGIIGYTGKKTAAPILVDGLRALEYRGYDSAGVALSGEQGIDVVKAKGRIDVLAEKLEKCALPPLNCGIGHTRWATHGEPSDANAHPHCTENLALVHNGIIENYAVIKRKLEMSGYPFLSETDTEVAAKLIDSYYKLTKNPVAAIYSAVSEIRGSFAF